MFFSVDRETLRWTQKTLSRARRSGNWSAVFAREACWTPEVFAALVDEHDRLLLEGQIEKAGQIGPELPRLAERIRANLCPSQELGKNSVVVWALAVAGSTWRASGAPQEAEASFSAASEKAKAGVFPWARAELDKRFAVHLLHSKSRQAFVRANEAIAGFAGFPDPLAEAFNLRGVCRAALDRDSSGAILDFAAAAALSDPTRSERSGWALQAASHNLAVQLIHGEPCSLESLSQARKLVISSREALGQGLDVRKLRSLWVEGLLVYRIGWNRHGERLLERARQGFLKLGCNEEYTVTSLDLVVMLIGDGETARAEQLYREIGDRLSGLAGTPAPAWVETRVDLDQVELLRGQLVEKLRRLTTRAESRRALL